MSHLCLQAQAVNRLLEHGLAKQDARGAARGLQSTLQTLWLLSRECHVCSMSYLRVQELEAQAVNRLLEHGLAKQDARGAARGLQSTLDSVRQAEAAVEKLHRSLSRHKVSQLCWRWAMPAAELYMAQRCC